MKHQKTQRKNPFKAAPLKNAGVERVDKSKRLDVDALVINPANIDMQRNRGFVYVPQNKQVLHPARYFERLYLSKATAKGMNIQDVIDNLDISVEHFDDFLSEKVCVDTGFAKKLEIVTGMTFEFWLRTQNKFDDSNKVHSEK
ncbi:hypothetical protein C2869_08295 [Saccharobesus litoralis]|uniref:Uncharacterized protein n=1 Tax=Saccharobesus litoralis TaxID=2172099 RepID=A0A2S0VQD7_9ALTE|nr:hypothetical protein [Saccharobesus litoralis]AWB66427.1 hypothetical protein C2869_08295 [Saccharobesus litoralis]